MAYQVTMTKGNVTKTGDVIYSITVNCVVNDGVADVFERSITVKYNTNTTNLDAMKAAIMSELKEEWDKYVAEQDVKNAAAFDAALSDMQTQATAYVNS